MLVLLLVLYRRIMNTEWEDIFLHDFFQSVSRPRVENRPCKQSLSLDKKSDSFSLTFRYPKEKISDMIYCTACRCKQPSSDLVVSSSMLQIIMHWSKSPQKCGFTLKWSTIGIAVPWSAGRILNTDSPHDLDYLRNKRPASLFRFTCGNKNHISERIVIDSVLPVVLLIKTNAWNR